MPFQRERYPTNWKAISQRIRFERAGNKCEWCGVQNGAIGYRDKKSGAFTHLANSRAEAGMDVENASNDGRKIIQIVLTVAHLGTDRADGTLGDKHDKMDVRDENLAALCQRCHLVFDIDEHVANAAQTRARKWREAAREAGQTLLFA